MTNYRVASEGMYILNLGPEQLPGLRKVPIWEGDHFPTFDELRAISANQADIETQARLNGLANSDEAEKIFADLTGEQTSIPSYWPLLVQRQRVGKILGYKTLGTVRVSDLLAENEENFELKPYWRHIKHAKHEKTSHEKELNRKMLKISLGVGAAAAAEIWYFTKGIH